METSIMMRVSCFKSEVLSFWQGKSKVSWKLIWKKYDFFGNLYDARILF